MSNRAAVASLIGLVLCGVGPSARGQAKDVVKYVELDALGNIRVVTDDKGNVIERHDYLPFGEECNTGPCSSNPEVRAGEPRKFTGKERDAETGLDYFGARYYRANTARFTTVDPAYTLQEDLLDPQRWNRYAYARNNPLRYKDPDGRVIDTIADAGFITFDVSDIYATYRSGNKPSGTQWFALGGDIVGAAIPFVTGVGAVIRGGAKAEHAIEAANAASHIAEQAKGGTYILRDAEGAVARTGRTNDLGRRAGEHARAPETSNLAFEVDKRTESYAAQRGREQVLHETHAPPLNKVNPVSPKNPRRQEYLDAAKKLENQ